MAVAVMEIAIPDFVMEAQPNLNMVAIGEIAMNSLDPAVHTLIHLEVRGVARFVGKDLQLLDTGKLSRGSEGGYQHRVGARRDPKITIQRTDTKRRSCDGSDFN